MVKALIGSNVMPGGRVTQVEIDPPFVRFAVGSQLRQEATEIPDALRLTISIGVKAPADPSVDLLVFGNTCRCIRIIDDTVQFIVKGPVFDDEGSSNLGQISMVGPYPTDQAKHHIFASVKIDVDGDGYAFESGNNEMHLYVDGVSVGNYGTDVAPKRTGVINAVSPQAPTGVKGDGALVDGFPMAVPADDDSAPVELAYVQAWFGTYVDPTAASTSAKEADATAATPFEIQLVDETNKQNVDPLMMLTAGLIESPRYGPGNAGPVGINPQYRHGDSQYQGIFQFNTNKTTQALIAQEPPRASPSAPVKKEQLFNTNDALTAFIYYWTSTGPRFSNPYNNELYSVVVSNKGLSDPTGLYRYLVHNQGAGTFRLIITALNGTPNKLVGSFPVIGSEDIPHNLLNQAWNAATWGTKLSRASTITQWITNFTNFYNNRQTRAARLLGVGSKTNITYFYESGIIRTPYVAQDKFGRSDVLFGGVMADMILNQGTGGDFDVVQIIGITDEP